MQASNNRKPAPGMGGGHGPGGMGRFMGQKPKNFKQAMKKLIVHLKPFYRPILISLILAAASTVFNIFGPRLIGDMINAVSDGVSMGGPGSFIVDINFELVNRLGFILIGLYVTSYVFNIAQSFLLTKVTQRLNQSLRNDVSTKINRMPLAYFDSRSYGDVLSVVTNDIDTISNSLNQAVTAMITAITSMIGILIMMLTISWQLTLVTLALLPLSILAIKIIMGNARKYFRAQQSTLGKLNGHIEEIYSGHQLIKVFNAKQNVESEFNTNNEGLESSAYKSQFLSGLMMPVMGFIGNLSYISVAVFGGYLAATRQLQVGYILSMIQYNRRFTNPMDQIAQSLTQLQSAAAAAERVFDFLDEKEMANEVALADSVVNKAGNIEFKHVKFGYTPDRVIIKDFNLSAKSGQKIAIVGPTGAGKTTLVNLLMKFYEINEGDIIIDGQSIHSLRREAVHQQFGMVLQDAWLFTGTIYDNLRYGNPKATKEEVKQAAIMANIDHFIESLPGGYDYVMSEESGISSGQKQLLTIARAMVTNAPMLILDEATSSVDTRTEMLIQQAMDNLMSTRTSFVIAHRLSTIKNADIILVMNEGDIIESGSHDVLMAKEGFYAKLYQSQFDRKNQYATE
ncbi:MAG: ABC transporter ATP-binding protein [Acholeplasma sp.]|jgi:ATP-binding cassette subfamily B protein|nr:ABC transporter ATP-binding protein [Acholeplasma sp.]